MTRATTDPEHRIAALEKELDEARRALHIEHAHTLSESESKLRTILDSVHDAIVSIDDGGIIESFNRAAERLFGYSAEEAVGGSVEILMPDDVVRGHEAHLLRYLSTGETTVLDTEREMTAKHRDGTLFPIELRASRSPHGFIAIMLDIRERVRARWEGERLARRTQQNEKLEALGTLASGIAHDLNNLLTPIFTYTHLLRESIGEGQDVDDINDMLDGIRHAADRGAKLVKQILAFGRARQPESKPIDLARVVEETMALVRVSLPSTIILEAPRPRGAWTMIADASQIESVLLNLCLNGAHAMRAEGGRLRVTLERLELEDGAQVGLRGGPHALLSVSDTGTGIPDDVLPRLFDPFFTTKPVGEGTGMGLATAYGIVKSHGGTIQVRTEPGEGTTFTVCLPLGESERSARSSDQPTELRDSGELSKRLRVLLVDDELMILEPTTKVLARAGWEVHACLSAVDAIEELRGEPSAYDVALIDYTMPHMNGIRLLRELRAISPRLPIVMLTGMASSDLERELASVELAALLLKPCRPNELLEALRVAVDVPPAAGSRDG